MELMTVVDLEKESQISQHTWRRWLADGRLPVVRLGRRVRVTVEDYRQFVADGRLPGRPK